MFHRAASTAKKNMSNKTRESSVDGAERKQYQNRVESSAVQRYAKSQEALPVSGDLANQNKNMPIEVQNNSNINETTIYNEKEVTSMNNPEPQTKDNSPAEAAKPTAQNRDVNIPGNNFQRPGAQTATARPSYPGSYAANTAASNPYASQNQSENGRKLVIGQGITMSGEIESCEHLIVEGTIEATLKGASVLDVYESGAFLGTVEIDEANIAGRFEGDITVSGRLTIESTGIVVGSISYKELSMEAGAVIDGAVSPIGSANAVKKTNGKSAPKAKKATQNNGAELPFSDKAQAAE